MAEPQHFFGSLEQVRQQLPLPPIPHTRSNRADINNGQDEQQPEPFKRLHLIDEIKDSLEIGKVAFEGRC